MMFSIEIMKSTVPNMHIKEASPFMLAMNNKVIYVIIIDRVIAYYVPKEITRSPSWTIRHTELHIMLASTCTKIDRVIACVSQE